MKLYLIKSEASRYVHQRYWYHGRDGYCDEDNDSSAFKAIIKKFIVERGESVNKVFFTDEKSAIRSMKTNIRMCGDKYYNYSVPEVIEYTPSKAEADLLLEPLLKELKRAEEKYLKLKAQYEDLIK